MARARSGGPGLLPQLRLNELLSELQERLEAVLTVRDRMNGLLRHHPRRREVAKCSQRGQRRCHPLPPPPGSRARGTSYR